jgi:plasmid stabilization system protein ParE
MSTFRVSNAAVSDMLDIGSYTEDAWGIDRNNIYLKRLDKAFHSLAGQPKLDPR